MSKVIPYGYKHTLVLEVFYPGAGRSYDFPAFLAAFPFRFIETLAPKC